MTSKILLCNIAKSWLIACGTGIGFPEDAQYTGCSHNHKRNMLEINCSTLQFWGHGALYRPPVLYT